MGGRVVFLVTSPRLPAGLLTLQGWDCLRSGQVCAGADSAQVAAIRASGIEVTLVPPTVAALLAQVAAHSVVVWLADASGDGALARELGMRLVRAPDLAELELLYGSWDPPGARLLDVVTVLDRLVAPGGDPWLSQHATGAPSGAGGARGLANYLLEEAYEAYDALLAGDLPAIREELGDVLLQVVLHARISAAAATGEFTIDDVAGDLVAKLIRRNPHVFAGADITDLDEITRNWEKIKRAEKDRDSAMDGIALSQPALALAAAVLSRAARAAAAPTASEPAVGSAAPTASEAATVPLTGTRLGLRLLALVEVAQANGLDAEGALRQVVLARMAEIRRAESAVRSRA